MYDYMSKGKKIEAEVVLCMGETDRFIEVPFTLDTATIFVEDVKVELRNVDLNLSNGECCNTVIFSGNLFIDVIYKVYETPTTDDATGIITLDNIIRHQTKLVPISGCIPVDCKKFKKCDKVFAKLVDVCISENHVLTNVVACTVHTAFPAYCGIREQVCIKIKAKVVRDEIIEIDFEEEDHKDRECKC